MTNTDREIVERFISLLRRPHGNLTGGEKAELGRWIGVFLGRYDAAVAQCNSIASERDQLQAENKRLRKVGYYLYTFCRDIQREEAFDATEFEHAVENFGRALLGAPLTQPLEPSND